MASSLYGGATRSADCVDNDVVAPTDHRGSMKTLWDCSSALLSAISMALSDHIDNGGAVNASMEPPLSSRGVLDGAIVATVETTL